MSDDNEHRQISVEMIRASLLSAVEDVLQLPSPSLDLGFSELGGNSLAAVIISDRISRELGLEVQPDLLYSCPTLNDVAEAAARR